MRNYKALGAILTLKEFDVTELVRFSGLELNTVYSILRRHAELFEKIGSKRTGRPGGKLIRYRVKPDRIAELERIREEHSAGLNPRKRSVGLTAGILSAERIFLERFPKASDSDKVHLLRIAQIGLPEQGEINEEEPLSRQTHLRLLLALRELCEAELQPEQGRTCFAGISEKLESIAKALDNLGEAKKSTDVLRRLAESPLNLQDEAAAVLQTESAEESSSVKLTQPQTVSAVPAFVSPGAVPFAVPASPVLVLPTTVEAAKVAIVPSAEESEVLGNIAAGGPVPAAPAGAVPAGLFADRVMVFPMESADGQRYYVSAEMDRYSSQRRHHMYSAYWGAPRALSPENHRVVDTVLRISAIPDGAKRMEAALNAAREQYAHYPSNIGYELERLLKEIDRGPDLRLNDENVRLLAFVPAFYCQKLVRSRTGYFLHVKDFLSALESYSTHSRDSSRQASLKRRPLEQDRHLERLYAYAES